MIQEKTETQEASSADQKSGGFSVPPDFIFKEDGDPYRYFLNDLGLPSPSSLFKEFGLVDARFYGQFPKVRGTSIHKAIQFDNEGDLNESNLDNRIAPHVEAFRKFKKDNLFVPIVELCEKPIISRNHIFGTKPDCVGFLGKDRMPTIVEIKSGTTNHWTFCLQTAAQQIALAEYAKFNAVIRMAVQTKSDATYKPTVHADPADREKFLALVNVHWLRRRGEKQ